ncbi:LacI family DNA-binding transcriptional regulator [Clavibacter zhangzhiyongii]|uniref:LacI family DNA-binding transcriptional regulator n=1 Tax=Clavibacter zhangzhiyongii TaxID=2768071 RepID=UPI0039E0E499
MSDTFPAATRQPGPDHGAGTTLGLIAREANVSIGTVSKVLNGRKGISPATRARVEELMERHGYSRRGPSGRTAPSSRSCWRSSTRASRSTCSAASRRSRASTR